MERDALIDLIRRAPMLDALRDGPLDRRDLEHRLGLSKSSVHRHTSELAKAELLERTGHAYELTEYGYAIAAVVGSFEDEIETSSRLAPLYSAVAAVDPPCPVDAFADATVVEAEGGDPFGPLARFVSLVEDTQTLRVADSYAVAPTYIGEIYQQVIDGMQTEVIETADSLEEIMANYPRKCIELCASDYLTLAVHDELPLGIALFDRRVGVAIRDDETRAPKMFIDTAAEPAREWAEAVFEGYAAGATRLERFNPVALDEAIDRNAS